MSRKSFIESCGATCNNWTTSWSFVNHERKFVIFGAWDTNVEGEAERILSEKWRVSAKGRVQPGYTQAIEHLRLVEEDGYRLMTFPMEFSDEDMDDDGNGPARIKSFKPELHEKKLTKVGDSWFAVDSETPNEQTTALNTSELDEQGRTLLALLVARLPKAVPNDPRTFIGYKEVHTALHLPQLGPTFGDSLKVQGLNSLADWTFTTGRPAITGLIIDRDKLEPGEGYFQLFGVNKQNMYPWWAEEIRKSKAYDWSPYVSSDEDDGWSREELQASVEAYVDMQRKERNGEPFTKKRYYEDLAARFGRSEKAFEYRMQNISYVLSLMGRQWLTGLKPAKNVGARVAGVIEELLNSALGTQSSPVAAFEVQVAAKRTKQGLPKPSGNSNPTSKTGSVTQYDRDGSVKAWVLEEAKGICECCEKPAPFIKPDGYPYLEVHHVRQLADKGSDRPENAVAICPNCHTELHYGQNALDLVERLYQRVERLVRE